MISVDPRNGTAQRFAAELAAYYTDDLGDDLIVVIGGDGFMLQTVGTFGLDRTYLGLNAGRIGFLLNDVTDWASVGDQLRRRAWTTYSLPMLEAIAEDTDGERHTLQALNDVVVERSSGQTAHIRLSVDGREVVERLVCDGVIFATALGSTAYTFSAGGPACHPTLEMLAVTAICPHKPRLAPFLLPPTSRARVELHVPDRRPVRVAADGRQIGSICNLEVGHAAERVRFAWLEGHDLTARMVSKILRA